MQSINPPTPAQLLAVGQEPLLKFEIYVGSWINLCTLNGKNYVGGVSVSLGGAGMAPDPVAGTWDAMLSNENGIFHPQHPSSAYKDYCKTGRKTRISIGATYGGTPYYWQRIIGFMDEPSLKMPSYEVSIRGVDYMKFLQDMEFRRPDNYWGDEETFSSISSEGLTGPEKYAEGDAMEIGGGEAHNVTNWTPSDCTFVSYPDVGGGSDYVGRMKTSAAIGDEPYAINTAIFTPTANTWYEFRFKYKIVVSDGDPLEMIVIQGGTEIAKKMYWNMSWSEDVLYFETISTDTIQIKIKFYGPTENDEIRVDQFSIKQFIPYYERYYQISDVTATGPFRVLLKQNSVWEDVWQGEEDEGWYYAADAEPGPDPPAHPARIVWFDINKKVIAGTNNLKIYYFTPVAPEDAVARILYKAGLYASEAAAKAAMDYTATGITIDKVWFKEGSTGIHAIKMLCERCDYRFHFKYDGTPVFKPKPAGAVVFTFTSPSHIASFSTYQDRNEIKNRIVIRGLKKAAPVGIDDSMPSELQGEANDPTSITAYGERTLSIKNDLFQDQTSIDNMCTSLLAEYKDPKWYTDLSVPFNPVPLELGDKIQWEERLSPVLNVTQTGIIRDIKIDSFNTTYRCEKL